MKMRSNLSESLRSNDLAMTIKEKIDIDVYSSKMGEDKDVCVLSFTAVDREPAKDLMEFVEKGYEFVLDADVSAGESKQGEYQVFVEILRTPQLIENIMEMIYGVRKLTGIKEWNFKYYKNSNTYDLTENNLQDILPLSNSQYNESLNEYRTQNIKQFFNKTVYDDITLDENTIRIKKPFGQVLELELVSENPSSDLTINENDTDSIAEVFWLTKVLGDYEITKYQEGFMLSNNNRSLLVKRSN